MRYELYVEKLKKRKSRVKKFIKLLPIIIPSACLALGGIIALCAMKGHVYKDSFDSYTYQDKESFNPKAFLSNAKYEIFDENNNKVEGVPEAPGSYSYKIYSKKLFSGYKVASKGKFEVYKRNAEVTLEDNTIEYGNEPVYTANLSNGDYIKSYDYSFESMVLSNTRVIAKDIVIYNKDDKDVSSYYDINTSYEDITFTKCPVVIRMSSAQKVYDGTPLVSKDYEVEGLLDGDTLSLKTSELTYAGSSENTVKSITFYDKDGNVNANYRAEVIPGTLTINKQEVVVKTPDLELYYNSNEQSGDSYQSDVILPDAITAVYTKYKNAGTYENKVIFDSNNKSLLSSYDFNYEYGELKINKIEAILNVSASQKEYDGLYDAQVSYNIPGIGARKILNDNAEITFKVDSPNVGTHEVFVENISCVIDGEDIIDNFEIINNFEDFTIIKKNLVITPEDFNDEYCGEAIKSSKYIEVEGLLIGNVIKPTFISSDYKIGESSVLLDDITILDDKLDVTQNYEVIVADAVATIVKRKIEVSCKETKINYGDILIEEVIIKSGSLLNSHECLVSLAPYELFIGDNTLSIDSYVIMDDTSDVSELYEVELANFDVKLFPKDIVFTLVNKTKIYDGTMLNYEDDEYYLDTELVMGDVLTFTPDFVGMIYKGTQSCYATSSMIEITDGAMDKAEYYNIKFKAGILQIKARDITIESGSKTSEFNFNYIAEDSFNIYNGVLVSGDTCECQMDGVAYYVGKVLNEISSVKITNADGRDVTDSYNITLKSGILEVIERSSY